MREVTVNQCKQVMREETEVAWMFGRTIRASVF